MIAKIQLPDGRIARFEVPEGTTEEQVLEFAKSLPAQEKPKEKPSTSYADKAKNIGMGALKGASDIGATLLYPLDATGLTGMTNRERRDLLKDFFSENANTDTGWFKGGELAADVAGTAGIGGILGKGVQAIGAAPKLVSALSSGGFNLGGKAAETLGGKAADALLRAGAGAATGGASAGLINPEEVGTGALIGGALPGAVKAAGLLGGKIKDAVGTATSNVIGSLTGTGAESIRGAFAAGKNNIDDFLQSMRGKTPFEDIVDRAKAGIANMRAQRSEAYRSGMLDISKDKSVLDFSPISEAMGKVSSMGSYKGQQINKNASGIVDDLKEVVSKWGSLDKKEFHTPEGLDALKQAIGDIRDSTQLGTSARRAADSVYNAVKEQINKQAPTYAKVMSDYSTASKTIKELEKSLSLGETASKDTAIRKLQSLMRNNAQTSYGNRLDLAKKLEDQGNADILGALAGQSLNTWTPRGMVGAIEKAGIPIAAYLNPMTLAAAPMTSPRIMGELAYKLGRAQGGINKGLKNSRVSGLLDSGQEIGRYLPVPFLISENLAIRQ